MVQLLSNIFIFSFSDLASPMQAAVSATDILSLGIKRLTLILLYQTYLIHYFMHMHALPSRSAKKMLKGSANN